MDDVQAQCAAALALLRRVFQVRHDAPQDDCGAHLRPVRPQPPSSVCCGTAGPKSLDFFDALQKETCRDCPDQNKLQTETSSAPTTPGGLLRACAAQARPQMGPFRQACREAKAGTLRASDSTVSARSGRMSASSVWRFPQKAPPKKAGMIVPRT